MIRHRITGRGVVRAFALAERRAVYLWILGCIEELRPRDRGEWWMLAKLKMRLRWSIFRLGMVD